MIDLLDIGFRGAVTGYRRVTALGNNPSIDTTATEDVWSGGGLYPWMTAATSLEVVSSSASDAAAGTGARTVRIDGLDASYAEISKVVVLNGTTAVPAVTNFYRINSVLVLTAGSGETNEGDITVRDTGAGTTRAICPAGYGITRQSVFTVPAGHTLQIISQVFCINRPAGVGRFATFATFVRTSGGVRRLPLEVSVGDEPPYLHEGIPGVQLNEKTDFCHRCSNVSSNGTDVTGGWLGVMKRNPSA